MNNEIKEILNNDIPMFVIDSDGYTVDITETVHNVITNLQQENEILRKNAEHNDKVVDKARWNEMLYKSRIDKATALYLKELNKMQEVDKLACDMFNILEGNK